MLYLNNQSIRHCDCREAVSSLFASYLSPYTSIWSLFTNVILSDFCPSKNCIEEFHNSLALRQVRKGFSAPLLETFHRVILSDFCLSKNCIEGRYSLKCHIVLLSCHKVLLPPHFSFLLAHKLFLFFNRIFLGFNKSFLSLHSFFLSTHKWFLSTHKRLMSSHNSFLSQADFQPVISSVPIFHWDVSRNLTPNY
jgi:hypothetical protein